MIRKIKNERELLKLNKEAAAEFKVACQTNIDLLRKYREMVELGRIKESELLEKTLKTRAVRTLSGVAIISVLTRDFGCPGNCLYCPTQKEMPKSYLSNEPAVMRAVAVKFDPFEQVRVRLEALKMTGHKTSKVELIVMGGTFSALSKNYQEWFLKRCFDALNGVESQSLWVAQKENETAAHRCVGLTLETRPDYINREEVERMRVLGATRVELGVQSIFDDVLEKCQRGHKVEATVKATKLLKDAGFKINYHMMVNLPGSDLEKDFLMFKTLFSDSRFCPDMLKIYPCVVVKESALYKVWKEGRYMPYTDEELFKLLLEIKKIVPRWVRIVRLIRDIPSESIEAGNKVANLRQYLALELKKQNLSCQCIRCREVREKKQEEVELFREKYKASGGEEVFLTFENKKRSALYALLRLRKTSLNRAIIREVHTYGEQLGVGEKTKGVQHKGWGGKLLKEAERIACDEWSFNEIEVISGIGVREYYKKKGYNLRGNMMVKIF